MEEQTAYYVYEVTYVNSNGETETKTVLARHEFEAAQLAGAINKIIISIVNLDI